MKHTVEEIKLKNGATGLLIDIPGASVMSTRIQFRAGMRYAKNHELYEIPHVVEHLAFGANSKYKDEQAFEAEFTKKRRLSQRLDFRYFRLLRNRVRRF